MVIVFTVKSGNVLQINDDSIFPLKFIHQNVQIRLYWLQAFALTDCANRCGKTIGNLIGASIVGFYKNLMKSHQNF